MSVWRFSGENAELHSGGTVIGHGPLAERLRDALH